MIPIVREATADDLDRWRGLRRDGIANYPSAFMLTLAQHDASDPQHDTAALAAGGRFMAFDGATAVGLAGVTPMRAPSMAHRAEIGPFYVAPAAQGSAAAALLVQAVVTHALSRGVWQLELTVNAANDRAVAFYTREGFQVFGRLPNAVIGPQGPENDLMMLRILPHPS